MDARVAAAVVLLIGGAVGAGMLGERVTSRQARKDRVTVIYWEKWTGSEGMEMRKVIDAFNRSQDRIFVKYLSISGVDSKTRLATAGGTPPDVAGIWQDQVAQFYDANALTDLTAMAVEAGLTREYYIPAYYDALTVSGKLCAVPSTPASIALHVRPDLVPAAINSPETFPETIEELDAMAFDISKQGPNGSLELAGFLPSSPGWWNWAWSGLFGGNLIEGDRIAIDSPEARRAFRWIASYSKRFGSKEVQSFQSGFGNFASPQDPFMNGKTATELNGVWKANYIDVYKPGLTWFAVPFPYPKDRPDLKGHSILSQDVLIIPRGAKHSKEAFEFLRFVQRQDVMEGLCIAHGKNSPLQKVSEEFFRKHPNPYIRLFDELARSPKAITPPANGLFPQISNEISVAFQEVNTGTKSPDQALKDAQARIDRLWSTYRQQVLEVTQ
jgi:ABC-type glycerol-3-phosphate transport system substrate-binding protein